jgi:plasmid stabilization system protein ParE
MTEEELQAELRQYALTFSSVISAATQEIGARTRDRTIRRRTLLWKAEMIPLASNASYIRDPQQAYVATLVLTVGMRQYLEDGSGAALFGEHQPIAVEAARELEGDARALGARFLDPAELDRLAREVEALGREHPIRGEFSPGALVEGLTDPETRNSLAWAVNLPMAPFRALTGVSEGGQAMRDFNQTARQLAHLLADFPHMVRWQLELLLYDVEDRETTLEGLAAFQVLAESSRRFSEAFEALPEDLTANASPALESARETVREAGAALAQVQNLVGPLSGIAEQLREAGEAWSDIAREVGREEEPRPDSRPFDIREYERTAQETRSAAEELKALVAEVRALAQDPELPTTVAGIEGSGRSLVDAAAWRAFQLMLVFFFLILVYRLVSSRIGR